MWAIHVCMMHETEGKPSQNEETARRVEILGLPVRGGHVLTESEVAGLELETLQHMKDFANSLRGQFAIIIRENGRTVVITDPFGSYPVYYTRMSDGKIAVGVGALDLAKKRRVVLNQEAIFSVAAFGRNVDQESLFKGVYEFLPGTIYTIDKGQLKTTHYFRWEDNVQATTLSYEEAKDKILSTSKSYLSAIVNQDGAVGCLFSGGVDSSFVCGVLREFFPAVRVKGFSLDYGFIFSRYSEYSQAARHARQIGLELGRVGVSLRRYYEAVREILSSQNDVPPIDSSVPLRFSLSRAGVAEGFRILLIGENGDECFCGYPGWFDRLGGSRVSDGFSVEERIEKSLDILGFNDTRSARKLVKALGLSEKSFCQWLHVKLEEHEHFLKRCGVTDIIKYTQFLSETYSGAQWARQYLPIERSLGVHLVSPFLDIEMVRLGLSFPLGFLHRNGKSKYILRDIVNEITGLRPEKRGTPSPLRPWSVVPIFVGLRRSSWLRRACLSMWARNLAGAGRTYQDAYKLYLLAAWLEKVGLPIDPGHV